MRFDDYECGRDFDDDGGTATMTATKTLTIHHSNGNQTRYADTMRDALRMLKADYGDDIVLNDQWDSAGPDRERKLVWTDEDDACGDDGQNAVAEIIRAI